MVFPYNRQRNLTKYIVDSSGQVYELTHLGHNNIGFRKYMSFIWNISNDIYSVTIHKDKDVFWLKETLVNVGGNGSIDSSDLRQSIVNDLEKHDQHEILLTAISRINL